MLNRASRAFRGSISLTECSEKSLAFDQNTKANRNASAPSHYRAGLFVSER